MSKSKRNIHAGKSKQQRQQYTRAIGNLDYEQTNDESLDFDNSDNPREEFTAERTGLQKEPANLKIKRYLSEHIVGAIITGLVTLAIAGLSLLAIRLNRESGSHETAIKNNERDIEKIQTSIETQDEKITNMRIEIKDNAKEIEFINRELQRGKKDINEK